ncbi:KICSTOR complex protein ITFG2-like [Styela clava]
MATTNRTVSFVSHLELNLDLGKVLPHAMTFGDVDNDRGNELVVGTTEGYLYIYRGYNAAPWNKVTDLGSITCIIVGDIMESGKNLVAVLNTEGTCYVFDFSEKVPENENANKFLLAHKQLLQTNTKMLLLGDVDGDGRQELILCHTDRKVSACRWNKATESFVRLQEWKLRQSVGSITLHGKSDEGYLQIIASQPGCAYATLLPSWNNDKSIGSNNTQNETLDFEDNVLYQPMSSLSRSQNPAISCQIVGNICKDTGSDKGYFALCTLDGNIKLIEDDKILWSFQVDHQLFAMNKLDVLANGKEEVILCAWDGLTYIVDHDRNVVRFQYEENVQAFCAGQYAIEDCENVVCLVYANFRNKLHVYYDIRLPRLKAVDFLTEAESDPVIKQLLIELGAKTEEEKREMIRYCMYAIPSLPEEEVNLSEEKLELFKRKSMD